MNLSTYSAKSARSILIVAGEASGDMYGSELVTELRDRLAPEAPVFFGCGGDRMRLAGVETLIDIHRLAVLGPFEALSHMTRFFQAMRMLVHEASQRRPQVAILIDFPDFNLRLAGKLKALHIPVIYLISPQVWAWRSGRIKHMRETIDQMLVILPFEKDYYRARGMEVEYVGHPLVDRVQTTKTRAEFLRSHNLQDGCPSVSLLPGSRTKEIQFHLPIMLQAARLFSWRHPIQFLLVSSSNSHGKLFEEILGQEGAGVRIVIIEADTYNAVGHSDLAVVSSGTATLETALLGTPLITVFRISDLTWIVGQYLVRVPFYSLVNLIAGREVSPELFQKDFTAEHLYREMIALLDRPDQLTRARMDLVQVRERLGEGGAIRRAAEHIVPWLTTPMSHEAEL